MKKYLLTALLVSSFVFASAQTLPDVDDSAQIEDTSYYCPNITVSLYKGLNDRKTKGQVSELQKFLSDYFSMNISGGVFGQTTKNYVIKFQKENGLPSVGTVGKATREKIASICDSSDSEGNANEDTFTTPPTPPEFPTVPQKNTLKVYFNDNTESQYNTSGLTREKALSECKRVVATNTSATSAKCMWGYESIYNYSGSTLPQQMVSVIDSNQSAVNSSSFSINGAPTLRLYYDQNKKESMLMATFNVTVKASGQDVNLAINGQGVNSFYINLNNSNTGLDSNVSRNYSGGHGVTIARADSMSVIGADSYIVKSGDTAKFIVSKRYRPSDLLSGSYNAKIYLVQNSINIQAGGSLFTNSVALVGENANVSSANSSPKLEISQNIIKVGGAATVTINNARSTCDGSVRWYIDYGDGTTENLGGCSLIDSPNAPNSNSRQHVYKVAGDFVVNLYRENGGPSLSGAKISVEGISSAATAVVTDGPLVTLNYDSNSNEVSLTGKATVQITAGNSDLLIEKPGSVWPSYAEKPRSRFYMYVQDKSGHSGRGPLLVSSQSSTIFDDSDYWIVKAGESRKFNLSQNINVKQMFAGAYHAVPSLILQNGMYAGTNILNTKDGNYVTIVGEVSPYISSVVDLGGYITIKGARLNLPDNYLQIDGSGNSLVSKFNSTNEAISIKKSDYAATSNLSLGYHYIRITNSQTGNSNDYSFEVKTDEQVSNISKINFISPNQGEYWYPGKTQIITWESTNVSQNSQVLIRLRNTESKEEVNLKTVENVGKAEVIVPNIKSGAYYIEIKVYVNGMYYIDSSDQYIKIVNNAFDPNGPKSNAMSCNRPNVTGLASGEVACYGIWDYGDSFGNDQNMCPQNRYSGHTTGCKVNTSICKSGVAIASKMLNPTSMDVNSIEMSTFANNLKSSSEIVKKQIPTLWVYTCEGGSNSDVTASSSVNSLIPTVTFARTSGFVSSNISSNTSNVKIGSFTIQNSSSEDIVISQALVGLSYDGGMAPTNISNLKIFNLGIPVGNVSYASSTFTFNGVTVSSNMTRTFDIYADIGSASGSVTTGMYVPFTGSKSGKTGSASAAGVPISVLSASQVKFDTPILVSSSPVSQYVIGGTTFGIATFKLKTVSGEATVRELKLTTTGTDAIASVTISGITAPVVNGNVSVSGLSMPVNSTGVDVPVTVRFNGFRDTTLGGTLVRIIKDVGITLNNIEATAGSGSIITTQANVSSNKMIIVDSKPKVSVSDGFSNNLTLGTENKIGEVTISADPNGKIIVGKFYVTITQNGISNFSLSSGSVRDGNTNIPCSSFDVNTGEVLFFGYCYEISPGMSKTFSLFATVNGSQSSSYISPAVYSRLTSSEAFMWSTNFSSEILRGTGIYDFPTNSYVVKGKENSSSIKVTSPNGGEYFDLGLVSGKDIDFRVGWESTGISGNVSVYLSRSGYGMCLLGKTAVSNGSFGVNLGNGFNCLGTSDPIISGSYKVLIYTDTSAEYPNGLMDESDNYFNIVIPNNNLGQINSSNPQVLGDYTMCVNLPRNMHRGAESSSVKNLQTFLKDKGLLDEVTGFYGDKTITAVKDYQGNVGLPITGMVYEATRESIRKDSCGW